MRIAILGYSGAGKSTLAKMLSGYYHCPALFLDQIQFEPGWKERDKAEARQLARQFLDRTKAGSLMEIIRLFARRSGWNRLTRFFILH